MEQLPDETLIHIFYELPPAEAASLCETNSNLSRFCNEKSVRLTALKNFYRQSDRADITFVKLIVKTRGDAFARNLERLEALLDLHPDWVNASFSLRSDVFNETIYGRPLELAMFSPAVILLLLIRGADVRKTALLDRIDYASPNADWMSLGLEPEAPELSGTPSILVYSVTDPILHLLCMQNGHVLSWPEINFRLIHPDVLYTYARQHPPADLSILATLPNDDSSPYFAVLQLLQTVEDYTPINRDFNGSLIDVTIASYRPLALKMGDMALDLAILAPSPSNASFYELRQLDFLVGPLPDRVWSGGSMQEQLASLSKLTVTLPPRDMESAIEPVTIDLNYYSGVGLVVGLSLFGTGYTVERAEVMDQTINSLDEGFPIPPLDTNYDYRLDPSVTILPHLLQYEFFADEVHTVQYEHPDFVVGFKLAAQLNGVEPETVIQVIR